MKVSSYHLTLTAVFAAVYYVSSLISPFIPAIGLPDLQIKLEALMATVFGFLLGPYLGAAAALLGALIAWILPPSTLSPFGVPFLLSPPINALIVGLIFYRHWKQAIVIYGGLLLGFLVLPPSLPIHEQYIVPLAVLWDKVIAAVLLLPVIKRGRRLLTPRYQSILFLLLAFFGNQADNMWGADVFAVPQVYNGIFGLNVEIVRFLFTISPFIYPAIRLLQAIVATIITVPLLRVLRGTHWINTEQTIFNNSL